MEPESRGRKLRVKSAGVGELEALVLEEPSATLAVIARGIAPARSGKRGTELMLDACREMFRGRASTVLDGLAEVWWKAEHEGSGGGAARPRPFVALPIADRAALRDRVALVLRTRAAESMGDVAILEAEAQSILRIPERAFERVWATIAKWADERRANWENTLVTATAMLFAGDRVAVAHVGNGSVHRLRGADFEALTVPHTLRGQLLRDRPDASSSEIEAGAGVLVRGIGMGGHVAIDGQILPLERGDRYLLLGPGLADALPESELARSLRLRGVGAADDVVARTKGHPDGTRTAIAVEML
jgi:hypothetical protein